MRSYINNCHIHVAARNNIVHPCLLEYLLLKNTLSPLKCGIIYLCNTIHITIRFDCVIICAKVLYMYQKNSK